MTLVFSVVLIKLVKLFVDPINQVRHVVALSQPLPLHLSQTPILCLACLPMLSAVPTKRRLNNDFHHPVHLARSFRLFHHCTPGDYLQRWRIGLAQKLLRQGRALKLVATEVGYGSEAALSRAFSSHMGMSPRAWRSAQKVAADE